MEGFKSYLLSGHVPDEKKAGFYLYWVSQFYGHCNKRKKRATRNGKLPDVNEQWKSVVDDTTFMLEIYRDRLNRQE
jgi:hypothetical protein